MVSNGDPPKLVLTPDDLPASGFTPSGVVQFKETIQDYSNLLFRSAIALGDSAKANNIDREITHNYVKSATHYIAESFSGRKPTRWQHVAHGGEYIATAIGGAGAGHIDKPLGVIAFVAGSILAVLLYVYRVTGRKGE